MDAEHIVVLNDNNLGASAAREFGKNEPNEMIVLRVPELLRARLRRTAAGRADAMRRSARPGPGWKSARPPRPQDLPALKP